MADTKDDVLKKALEGRISTSDKLRADEEPIASETLSGPVVTGEKDGFALGLAEDVRFIGNISQYALWSQSAPDDHPYRHRRLVQELLFYGADVYAEGTNGENIGDTVLDTHGVDLDFLLEDPLNFALEDLLLVVSNVRDTSSVSGLVADQDVRRFNIAGISGDQITIDASDGDLDPLFNNIYWQVIVPNPVELWPVSTQSGAGSDGTGIGDETAWLTVQPPNWPTTVDGVEFRNVASIISSTSLQSDGSLTIFQSSGPEVETGSFILADQGTENRLFYVADGNLRSAITGHSDGTVLKLNIDQLEDKTSPVGVSSEIKPRDILWSYEAGTQVNALEVDDLGNVYVGAGSSVTKLDLDGNEIWQFTSFGNDVTGIAVDSDRNVYASSLDQTVRKIDPTGTQIWSVNPDSIALNAVAVDRNQEVYVAENGGAVRKILSGGTVDWLYSNHVDDVNDVTVDNGGTIHVYSASEDGDFAKITASAGGEVWKQTNLGGEPLRAVTVNPTGSAIFVGDSAGAVHKYDSTPTFIWTNIGSGAGAGPVTGMNSTVNDVIIVTRDASVETTLLEDQGGTVDVVFNGDFDSSGTAAAIPRAQAPSGFLALPMYNTQIYPTLESSSFSRVEKVTDLYPGGKVLNDLRTGRTEGSTAPLDSIHVRPLVGPRDSHPDAMSASTATMFQPTGRPGFGLALYVADGSGNPDLSDPITDFRDLDFFTGSAAFGVLRFDANALDGETVTIGDRVYTFQDTLTNEDGNVQIGVDLLESRTNLRNAINRDGTPGTDYADLTSQHADVEAIAVGNGIAVSSREKSDAANDIQTLETLSNAAWDNDTLIGGADDPTVEEQDIYVDYENGLVRLSHPISAGGDLNPNSYTDADGRPKLFATFVGYNDVTAPEAAQQLVHRVRAFHNIRGGNAARFRFSEQTLDDFPPPVERDEAWVVDFPSEYSRDLYHGDETGTYETGREVSMGFAAGQANLSNPFIDEDPEADLLMDTRYQYRNPFSGLYHIGMARFGEPTTSQRRNQFIFVPDAQDSAPAFDLTDFTPFYGQTSQPDFRIATDEIIYVSEQDEAFWTGQIASLGSTDTVQFVINDIEVTHTFTNGAPYPDAATIASDLTTAVNNAASALGVPTGGFTIESFNDSGDIRLRFRADSNLLFREANAHPNLGLPHSTVNNLQNRSLSSDGIRLHFGYSGSIIDTLDWNRITNVLNFDGSDITLNGVSLSGAVAGSSLGEDTFRWFQQMFNKIVAQGTGVVSQTGPTSVDVTDVTFFHWQGDGFSRITYSGVTGLSVGGADDDYIISARRLGGDIVSEDLPTYFSNVSNRIPLAWVRIDGGSIIDLQDMRDQQRDFDRGTIPLTVGATGRFATLTGALKARDFIFSAAVPAEILIVDDITIDASGLSETSLFSIPNDTIIRALPNTRITVSNLPNLPLFDVGGSINVQFRDMRFEFTGTTGNSSILIGNTSGQRPTDLVVEGIRCLEGGATSSTLGFFLGLDNGFVGKCIVRDCEIQTKSTSILVDGVGEATNVGARFEMTGCIMGGGTPDIGDGEALNVVMNDDETTLHISDCRFDFAHDSTSTNSSIVYANQMTISDCTFRSQLRIGDTGGQTGYLEASNLNFDMNDINTGGIGTHQGTGFYLFLENLRWSNLADISVRDSSGVFPDPAVYIVGYDLQESTISGVNVFHTGTSTVAIRLANFSYRNVISGGTFTFIGSGTGHAIQTFGTSDRNVFTGLHMEGYNDDEAIELNTDLNLVSSILVDQATTGPLGQNDGGGQFDGVDDNGSNNKVAIETVHLI